MTFFIQTFSSSFIIISSSFFPAFLSRIVLSPSSSSIQSSVVPGIRHKRPSWPFSSLLPRIAIQTAMLSLTRKNNHGHRFKSGSKGRVAQSAINYSQATTTTYAGPTVLSGQTEDKRSVYSYNTMEEQNSAKWIGDRTYNAMSDVYYLPADDEDRKSVV